MTCGEVAEIDSVGDLLRWPFAGAMLPDVMQDRQGAGGGQLAYGIEQWIVGAPAARQLDADGTARDAALDLGQRVRGVVPWAIARPA